MAFPKRGATLTGTLSASLLAISLIAGCSDPPSDVEEKAASSSPPSAEAPVDSGKQEGAASPGQIRGGDGSEITLNALMEEDMREASLAGELGCSFTTADGEVLLIAIGNVASSDAAQGVVKVTGEPTEGGESPPRPATLTYDRADGAQRDWQGEWRCGP
jgi:hypothetical protein